MQNKGLFRILQYRIIGTNDSSHFVLEKDELMSKKSQKLLIILLCVACFGAGVSVPVILNKTTAADGKEKEKFNTIYSILNSDWYYSNKIKNLDSKLMEQAIDGMTTLDKDAHTNYFDLEQAKAFSSSLEGSNVGLGISFYLNEKNHFVVSNVYVNSTADKKGLKPMMRLYHWMI